MLLDIPPYQATISVAMASTDEVVPTAQPSSPSPAMHRWSGCHPSPLAPYHCGKPYERVEHHVPQGSPLWHMMLGCAGFPTQEGQGEFRPPYSPRPDPSQALRTPWRPASGPTLTPSTPDPLQL